MRNVTIIMVCFLVAGCDKVVSREAEICGAAIGFAYGTDGVEIISLSERREDDGLTQLDKNERPVRVEIIYNVPLRKISKEPGSCLVKSFNQGVGLSPHQLILGVKVSGSSPEGGRDHAWTSTEIHAAENLGISLNVVWNAPGYQKMAYTPLDYYLKPLR